MEVLIIIEDEDGESGWHYSVYSMRTDDAAFSQLCRIHANFIEVPTISHDTIKKFVELYNAEKIDRRTIAHISRPVKVFQF